MKTSNSLFSVVIILVALSLLVAACAPAAAPTVPTEAPGTKVPATQAPEPTTPPEPEEPVVIRMALASDPMTLEPGLFSELYTSWVGRNMHAGLVTYDADGNLIPMAAERWELSDDGLTYTFHLRDDVMFHNGRKMVANDWKEGWTRYLTPDVQSNIGPEYFGRIVGAQDVMDGETTELTGVVAEDDQTLVVTLTEADPAFLIRLGSPMLWVVPSEAVVEGEPEWVDEPVGSGPFKFVEWRPNEILVLEAFDDFFLGRPQIDRIEYYIVPDPTTEVAMYEGGELDVAAVTYGELDRAASDPALSEELHYFLRSRLISLFFNYDLVPEFGDLQVRQAFAHAINRQQLAEVVMRNATLAAEGFVGPGFPSYDPNLKGAEYDPDRAKQLLADAGYPDGEGFPSLELSAYGANVPIIEAIGAMLGSNLGIDVVVNAAERGDMISAMWALDQLPFFVKGWTADRPSAEVWVKALLYCDLETGFANYCNPDLDAVIDQAQTTFDPDEQVRLWREAEQMAMDDVAIIPIMYDRFIYLVNPDVDGFRCSFEGPMSVWDVTVEQ